MHVPSVCEKKGSRKADAYNEGKLLQQKANGVVKGALESYGRK